MEQKEMTKEQKEYLEERKELRRFENFLMNDTDIGPLDCKGLVKIEELAEQIMPFFKKTENKE